MKNQMMKQTTAFMFVIFIGLTICLAANASVVSIFPETWFEISTEGGMHLDLEQGIVWVGSGDHSSRGFWQYSISSIASQFLTIDQLGFYKVAKIKYQDFNFKGINFFRNITLCEEIFLVMKNLKELDEEKSNH